MSSHNAAAPYYFVPGPSKWPLLAGISLLVTMIGASAWVNDVSWGPAVNFIGLAGIISLIVPVIAACLFGPGAVALFSDTLDKLLSRGNATSVLETMYSQKLREFKALDRVLKSLQREINELCNEFNRLARLHGVSASVDPKTYALLMAKLADWKQPSLMTRLCKPHHHISPLVPRAID